MAELQNCRKEGKSLYRSDGSLGCRSFPHSFPHSFLQSCHPAILQWGHSHSIVDGGFELMSYTTRLMPFTSFTMRDEMRASRS